jgi:hypothetical protein
MIKTKIRKYVSFQRILALLGLTGLILLSMAHPIGAQTLTQGYGTDENLQRGAIIKLKDSDTSKVEAVTKETSDKAHGVVVNANDAAVTLSSEGKKVFVATLGKYDVLVSTQGGAIRAGDFLSISALGGIAMKSGEDDSYVIGKALDSFDGTQNVLSKTSIKNSKNETTEVVIGRVQMDVGLGKNPLQKHKEPNLPEFLKKAAEAIAGKEVSATRVYIGLVVFFVTTIVAGILLVSGVRNGLISIGRNPLSRKSIIRGMFQVVITGLTIFIMGIFGVYLLLKL